MKNFTEDVLAAAGAIIDQGGVRPAYVTEDETKRAEDIRHLHDLFGLTCALRLMAFEVHEWVYQRDWSTFPIGKVEHLQVLADEARDYANEVKDLVIDLIANTEG